MIPLPTPLAPIRDIQPEPLLRRNELRVHVEAPRAHEIGQLRGLLCGRSVGRCARVREEEVGLGDRQLVGGVDVEVFEDGGWEGLVRWLDINIYVERRWVCRAQSNSLLI